MRETEYYSPPLAADYQHSEVMCINNVMWINRSLAHNTLQIRALYVLTRRTNYAGSPLCPNSSSKLLCEVKNSLKNALEIRECEMQLKCDLKWRIVYNTMY